MIDRDYLIDLAVNRYFANVDKKNLEPVLDCFNPDAFLCVQTQPIVHEGRDQGVKAMFETLFSSYKTIWHGNFEHTVDAEAERISSRFDVILEDDNGGKVELHNCNHWYCKDGRFQRVYVFMSGENVLR